MNSTKSITIPKILVIFFLIATLIAILASNTTASPPLDDPVSSDMRSPAKNPPKVDISSQQETEPGGQVSITGAPTTEWTYHKSTDGLHPDGREQQMMWFMNRARANPTQEGIWLATTNDPDVATSRDFFGVDLNLLQNEFASYAPRPPAAFDIRLYNAAKAHSDDLIDRDAQDHTGQFDRVTAAGFSLVSYRGNVFSYAKSGLNAHAGFNIDWGDTDGDGDGMQAGRGHRKAVMSLDGDYTNVGLAAVEVTVPGKTVGPFVVTGNYAQAQNTTDHYNRFLAGTVWEDKNGNSMYDPGEGIGGVTVTPNQGTYYAITANSGGYAIPLTTSGAYQVTFSGPVSAVKTVNVSNDSVLLDFNSTTSTEPKYFIYLPMVLR